MIAEWFYWLTSEMGRCFNNAAFMREHTYEDDIVTGTFILWFFILILFLLVICLFILFLIDERKLHYESNHVTN